MIIHLLQRKEKTLGSLSEDNEEERDEMPVISKEQCINNEVDNYIGSPRLDFEEGPVLEGCTHNLSIFIKPCKEVSLHLCNKLFLITLIQCIRQHYDSI